MQLPTTLFLASNNANFLEMYYVARFLLDKEKSKPLFLMENYTNITILPSLDLKGIVFLNKPRFLTVTWRKIENKLKRYVVRKEASEDVKKNRLSKLLKRRLRQCTKILNKYQPASVVLRGDRHLGNGWEPALIRAAANSNIPRIVINYAHPTLTDGFISKRRARPECNADLFPYIKKKNPGQFVFDEISGRNLLYRPAYCILALSDNGMLPNNPWVMGGSNSTLVLIDGEYNKAQYILHGVKEDKIRITGVVAHDKLFRKNENRLELKDDVYKKYRFDKNMQLVIFSPAQLFEEKLVDWIEGQTEFEYICRKFAQIEANCLLSLHPRMKRSHYLPIARKYNIHIAEESLSDILPAADLFSSTFSTTIDWAILCHIPTVIFDFYECIVGFKEETHGVIIENSRELFNNTVNKVLKDKGMYTKLKDANKEKSSLYSSFDGQCLNRIARIILDPSGN